jgi:CheY-like chemotaxis protein
MIMDWGTILVAEDDADDRFLVKAAFDETGNSDTLLFVENGVEVMETLNQRITKGEPLPQLILLDLNMPKKDGREVLRELKQHPLLKKIPVIIFSTTNNPQEIARCYDLGANSYITKPNSFEQLINILSAVRQYWLQINSRP